MRYTHTWVYISMVFRVSSEQTQGVIQFIFR